MRRIWGLLAAVMVFGLISCYMKTEHKIEAHITIDIREIEATANEIEDMVRARKGGQSLFVPFWKLDAAYAGIELKFMTPEVEKAISNRGGRLDSIEELMKKNCIGENNRGYVEYRACPACEKEPQLVEEAKRLIKEENQDRLIIYQTIVEQNNLSKDSLSLVEKIFSQVHQKNAPSGAFIQQDDGGWIKKY